MKKVGKEYAVYNEVSLQFELGKYIQEKLGQDYCVQFERNVYAIFGIDKPKKGDEGKFVKFESDSKRAYSKDKNMNRIEAVVKSNETEESTFEMLALNIELMLNDTLFEEEHVHQLSEEQFSRYKDFIITVAGAIKSREFQIIDEYQSDESYSYYIQFTPEFYEGTEPQVVYDVKFRLSNHSMSNKSSAVQRTLTGRVPVFRSFVVNGVEHKSILPTLDQIVEVLNDLHAGYYNSLLSYDTETSNNR